MRKIINGQVISTVLVIGAVGGGLFLISRGVSQGLNSAGTAINPVDQDNIFNRGFNGLFRGVTGSEGTLGTELADFFNPTGE